MPSTVQVCNMALGLIGAEPIQSLTADTETSRKCNLYIEQAIDETLRLYPWNCAIKLDSLAQLTETPAFKFDYVYSLPADCVRALASDYSDITFQIASGKLYTNETTFNLEYISRIGVNEMDAACRAALVYKLAGYLAFSISNSVTLQEQMEKLFNQSLIRAAVADTQEGTPEEVTVEDYLNARY